MKKLIMIGAVAAAMGLTACSKGGSNAPTTLEDSIAIYTAMAQGQGLARNVANLPEEMREKVNKEAFINGLKMILEADTASINDFVSGTQYATQTLQMFMQLKDAGMEIDRQLFIKEFAKAFMADSVSDVEMMKTNEVLTPVQEKMMMIMQKAQQEKMVAQQKAIDEKFEKNKAAGVKFVAEKCAADKGIKTTESGLAYKVTKMGTGAVAKDTDRVNVKYTGKLIDGTEFDSSKGSEVAFSPKSVVPGFAEVLTTLPAGTEVTVYIPENLGYGRQSSGKIEPGSTLVFDMTIGDVVAPAQPAQPAVKVDSVKTVKK